MGAFAIKPSSFIIMTAVGRDRWKSIAIASCTHFGEHGFIGVIVGDRDLPVSSVNFSMSSGLV